MKLVSYLSSKEQELENQYQILKSTYSYKETDQVILLSNRDGIPYVNVAAHEKVIETSESEKIIDISSVMEEFQHIRLKEGYRLIAKYYGNRVLRAHANVYAVKEDEENQSIEFNFTFLPFLKGEHDPLRVIATDNSIWSYWELILFIHSMVDYHWQWKSFGWKFKKILPIPFTEPLNKVYEHVSPYLPINHVFHKETMNFLKDFTWKGERPIYFHPHIVKRRNQTFLIYYVLNIYGRASIQKYVYRFEKDGLHFRLKKFTIATHSFGVSDLRENPKEIEFPTLYHIDWKDQKEKPWKSLSLEEQETEEEYHRMTPDAWNPPDTDSEIYVFSVGDHKPYKSSMIEMTLIQSHGLFVELFKLELSSVFSRIQLDSEYDLYGVKAGFIGSFGYGVAVKKGTLLPKIPDDLDRCFDLYFDKGIFQLPGIVDPMKVISGDGSPDSYWEAVLFHNTMEELGHRVYWGDRILLPIHSSILKENPYINEYTIDGWISYLQSVRMIPLDKITWFGPKPSIWHPHLIKKGNSLTLVYHVVNLHIQEIRLEQIICQFSERGLFFEQFKKTLAVGKEGYMV